MPHGDRMNKNMVGEVKRRELEYLLVSPASNTQPKSPRPYQIILLLSILIILIPLTGSLTLSSQPFSLQVTSDQNSISFLVEGQPNTPFSLIILDSKQNELFKRTVSTNSYGSYNLFLPVFDKGSYTAILRSGSQTVIKDFEVSAGEVLTTTTTLTSVCTTILGNETVNITKNQTTFNETIVAEKSLTNVKPVYVSKDGKYLHTMIIMEKVLTPLLFQNNYVYYIWCFSSTYWSCGFF